MKKSISFIIPCYQPDRQLLMRCLRSIRQLDTDWDWEAIVVDDGTPESCVAAWIDEMGDHRIRYYHYPQNQRQGYARNVGLDHAKKEYVHFLDSDDYLICRSFCQCLELVAEKQPDLLLFSFKMVKEMECVDNDCPRFSLKETSGTDYLLANSLYGVVCNVIIRRNILDGLRFHVGIIHEDEEFAPLMILRAKSMIITNIQAYAYYRNSGSTMTTRTQSHLQRSLNDLLTVIDELRKRHATLEGLPAKALQRRIDQLCEAYVFNLLRFSPDRKSLISGIATAKERGAYPVPPGIYNFKYRSFRHLTDSVWKMKLLYGLFTLKKLR